jgi:hypothetical protein
MNQTQFNINRVNIRKYHRVVSYASHQFVYPCIRSFSAERSKSFFFNTGRVSKDPELASFRHCRLHKCRKTPEVKEIITKTLQKYIEDLATISERDQVPELPPSHRRCHRAPATSPPPGSMPLGVEKWEEDLLGQRSCGRGCPTSVDSGRGDGARRRSRRRYSPLKNLASSKLQIHQDLPPPKSQIEVEGEAFHAPRNPLEEEVVRHSSAPPCRHGQPGGEKPHTLPATKLSPSLPQPAGRESVAGRRCFNKRERNGLLGAVGLPRCSLPLPVRPERRGTEP